MAEIKITLDDLLSHASDIIKTARGILAITLVACLYSLLTVAATKDVDLVLGRSSAELPIISTEVNILYFFFLAPWFLVGIQTYYLAYTHKLWVLLAKLSYRHPSTVGKGVAKDTFQGVDIEQALYPWLMMDFARKHRPNMPENSKQLSDVYGLVAAALSWIMVPLSISIICFGAAAFGARSSLELTLLFSLIISLSISIFVAVFFYNRAIETLKCKTVEEVAQVERSSVFGKSSLRRFSAILVVTTIFTIVVSENPFRIVSFLGPDANFERAEISSMPDNWPGQISINDIRDSAKLVREISAEQEAAERKVTPSNLARRDLRGARFDEAFAVRSDFSGSNLRRSSFIGTQLRRANFGGANFSGSFFRDADLSMANLIQVQAVRTRFWGTLFRGSDFRQANLSGSEFIGGYFEETDFSGANLSNVTIRPPMTLEEVAFGGPTIDLTKAIFGPGVYIDPNGKSVPVLTIVAGANLENATLTKQQEKLMCGDDLSMYPVGFKPENCPEWVLKDAKSLVVIVPDP